MQGPVIAARNLGKLGALQEAQGDRDTAAESYRQALAKEETGSGPDHARVAVRLNDLALLLKPEAANRWRAALWRFSGKRSAPNIPRPV